MGDNKRWHAADFAAVGWVVLHVYASVQAFLHSLYQTYTSWTWVLLAVWLLGLVALDVWLAGGRPGLQNGTGLSVPRWRREGFWRPR